MYKFCSTVDLLISFIDEERNFVFFHLIIYYTDIMLENIRFGFGFGLNN